MGNRVVFTGMKRGGSTINFVEDIIARIVQKEGIDPAQFEFYDLMTHRGYYGTEPGEFQFQRVTFEVANGQPVNPAWDNAPCPEEVIALFREHIGGTDEPYQMKSPMDHRPGSAKALETQLKSQFAEAFLSSLFSGIAESEMASGSNVVLTPQDAEGWGYRPNGPQSPTVDALGRVIPLLDRKYPDREFVIVDLEADQDRRRAATCRFEVWSRER